MTEAEIGVRQGPRAEKHRQPLAAKEAGKWILPSLPPESTSLCQHFDFSPAKLILDFWLQNCKIIVLCCFKPLSLVGICYSSNRKHIQMSSTFMPNCWALERPNGIPHRGHLAWYPGQRKGSGVSGVRVGVPIAPRPLHSPRQLGL